MNARLILADPPWLERGGGKIVRGAQRHYDLLPTKAICALPVADLAATDSVLLLWVTSNFLPDGLDVCRAWGFRYVTDFAWVKDRIGLGQWRRSRHEHLLLCVRGHPTLPGKAWGDSVIEAPRTAHSAKPSAQYDLARHLCHDGPWLELFSRTPQPGWSSFGNHIDGADIAESLRVAAGRLV